MRNSSEILRILIENENINPNQLAVKMGLKRTQPIYDILNGKIKKYLLNMQRRSVRPIRNII
jgi:hypothetical protein